MKKSNYLMESLEDFLQEKLKPHNEITNRDRLNSMLAEFDINPNEIYGNSLEGVYDMAKEIYNQRGMKYVRSGWVNPN